MWSADKTPDSCSLVESILHLEPIEVCSCLLLILDFSVLVFVLLMIALAFVSYSICYLFYPIVTLCPNYIVIHVALVTHIYLYVVAYLSITIY